MDKKLMAPPKISRVRHSVLPSTSKETPKVAEKQKARRKMNATLIDFDQTKSEPPVTDAYARLAAHQKGLRAVLADCLLDAKIKKEETEVDIQLGQLADRFSKAVDQLDKTNRRLKDIKFTVEQKRLIDLKSVDCSKFYETTDAAGTDEILRNLARSEQAYLDKLVTKNIDFGYNKESGHKQLLDAVNDAIKGFEEIKLHSHLDTDKLKQFEKLHETQQSLEGKCTDIDSYKVLFEKTFPNSCDELLQQVSEQIDAMMKND